VQKWWSMYGIIDIICDTLYGAIKSTIFV
jgi:hypothetical protein